MFVVRHYELIPILAGDQTLTIRRTLGKHLKPMHTYPVRTKDQTSPVWFLDGYRIDNPRLYAERTIGHRLGDRSITKFLQARGAVLATVMIHNVSWTPVQEITEHEAKRAGCQSLDEFATLWNRFNPRQYDYDTNPTVAVVRLLAPYTVRRAIADYRRREEATG